MWLKWTLIKLFVTEPVIKRDSSAVWSVFFSQRVLSREKPISCPCLLFATQFVDILRDIIGEFLQQSLIDADIIELQELKVIGS